MLRVTWVLPLENGPDHAVRYTVTGGRSARCSNKNPRDRTYAGDGHGCLVLKSATIDPVGEQIVCAMNPAIEEEVVQKMLDLQSTSN